MSLFAIEIVAVLFPRLVGLNVIEKVVLLLGVTGVVVELVFVLNSVAFVPVILTIGEPFKSKFVTPTFSIVNVTGELDSPTRTL